MLRLRRLGFFYTGLAYFWLRRTENHGPETINKLVNTYHPLTEHTRTVSARAVWALVHESLRRCSLKASDPELIVRCRLCGSVFRLGDAYVETRGNVGAPDWSC